MELKECDRGYKIVEPIEDRDSRGFVIYSDRLDRTVADGMQQQKPENHEIIVENPIALKTV